MRRSRFRKLFKRSRVQARNWLHIVTNKTARVVLHKVFRFATLEKKKLPARRFARLLTFAAFRTRRAARRVTRGRTCLQRQQTFWLAQGKTRLAKRAR